MHWFPCQSQILHALIKFKWKNNDFYSAAYTAQWFHSDTYSVLSISMIKYVQVFLIPSSSIITQSIRCIIYVWYSVYSNNHLSYLSTIESLIYYTIHSIRLFFHRNSMFFIKLHLVSCMIHLYMHSINIEIFCQKASQTLTHSQVEMNIGAEKLKPKSIRFIYWCKGKMNVRCCVFFVQSNVKVFSICVESCKHMDYLFYMFTHYIMVKIDVKNFNELLF